MPGGHKKQPFSGKQKKEQLKAKKEKKRQGHGPRYLQDSDDEQEKIKIVTKAAEDRTGEFTAFQARQAGRGQPGRYALIFRPETKEQIEAQKKEARKSIVPVEEEYLECSTEDFFPPELDFPTRPPWNYELSVEELENNEKKAFYAYLKTIDLLFEKTELSYFELNLETWRQLWRVLEMSDILLCIVDIRFPPVLFPPKLYHYVSGELKKNLVLILNKIDLAPAPLVLAWREYFKKKFPEIDVLCFTSFPSYNLHGNTSGNTMKGAKRKARPKMAAEGAFEVYKACEKIVAGEVNLTAWKEKILEEMHTKEVEEEEDIEIGTNETVKPDLGYHEHKRYQNGMLTIGCVGQPNVGKSSLINALMGKKVVSVSKTPGHTKHFQTIFLTPNVRLCDCPGLIFPSRVPKPLQVLCGSYPIAQLREPFTTVKYLAERVDLVSALRITHPEGDTEWSAFDICDGWAAKRGYYTAKAARLDSYRAANHILRLALEGRICLCLRPPNYHKEKRLWERHEGLAEILQIQAKSKDAITAPTPVTYVDSDLSDEEPEQPSQVEPVKPARDKKPAKASSEDDEDESEEEDDESEDDSQFSVGNKFALLNQNE